MDDLHDVGHVDTHDYTSAASGAERIAVAIIEKFQFVQETVAEPVLLVRLWVLAVVSHSKIPVQAGIPTAEVIALVTPYLDLDIEAIAVGTDVGANSAGF